ncbi:MAG: hypothetical protein JJV98_19595 [Desulfosarcina sp.]|nr:hypothetical protein [Desulfobacterales bacterium]
MPRHTPCLFFFLLVWMLGSATSPAYTGSGKITARVSLTDANGQVVYGDWVRVFLVTAAIDIAPVDLTGAGAALERASRINSGHTAFFIQFREMMAREGYCVDDKLTRPDGTVTFNRISPGRYYIVITFPTMIAGQKAAWQVPVDVVADRTVHVEMNAENMAIRSF